MGQARVSKEREHKIDNTPLAPKFFAASISIVPSPHPRSYTTSSLLTKQITSIYNVKNGLVLCEQRE